MSYISKYAPLFPNYQRLGEQVGQIRGNQIQGVGQALAQLAQYYQQAKQQQEAQQQLSPSMFAVNNIPRKPTVVSTDLLNRPITTPSQMSPNFGQPVNAPVTLPTQQESGTFNPMNDLGRLMQFASSQTNPFLAKAGQQGVQNYMMRREISKPVFGNAGDVPMTYNEQTGNWESGKQNPSKQQITQPKNSTKIETGKTRVDPVTGAFQKQMTFGDPVTGKPVEGAVPYWESSNPPQGAEKPDTNPTLSGVSYLKSLPTGRQALVKSLGEGRTRLRDVASYRGSQKMDLAKDVVRAYPTFNQAWIDASFNLAKDATTGNIGKNARSLNTAVGHLAQFDEAAKALKNVDITGYNSLANWIKAHTGDPRVLAVNETASALSSELASTFKGGASGAAGTEAEIKDWRQNFNSNLSQAQFDQAVNTTLKLMRSRLGALKNQYDTNPYADKNFEIISPEAKNILESYGFNPNETQQKSGGGNSPSYKGIVLPH